MIQHVAFATPHELAFKMLVFIVFPFSNFSPSKNEEKKSIQNTTDRRETNAFSSYNRATRTCSHAIFLPLSFISWTQTVDMNIIVLCIKLNRNKRLE